MFLPPIVHRPYGAQAEPVAARCLGVRCFPSADGAVVAGDIRLASPKRRLQEAQADHDWLEKIKTQSENAAQGAAVMKAKGFLRKDIVEELSRFELARLTQPHLPDTQSPDSARTVEEAVFTDADRTDAERLRAFAGDVRMLAAQRQAMGATVEQFVNDLDLMATGKPCRIEDRGW